VWIAIGGLSTERRAAASEAATTIGSEQVSSEGAEAVHEFDATTEVASY
jgi:hypothetical protein